jgi:hypothetical protein
MKLGLNHAARSLIILSHIRPYASSLSTQPLNLNFLRMSVSTTSLSSRSNSHPDPHPGYPLASGAIHPPIGYGTYKVGYVPPSSAAALSGSVKSGASKEEEDPR